MKKEVSLIWLVGGGTGGHVMPLFAVAELLKKHDDVHLVSIGGNRSLEQRLARDYGIRFMSIPFGKLRRYITVGSVLLNLRDSVFFLAGVIKAYGLIKKQKPALIFSKGGPVALPVAIAAWMTGTDLISHESDAVLGSANRLIARMSQTILTGFPASLYPLSYAKKTVSVGVPIRSEFCHQKPRATSHRPVIVLMGGSQGSLVLNEVMVPLLPILLPQADIIHITGEQGYKRIHRIQQALPEELKAHYTVVSFDPHVARLISQATVVISRASSAIFEIASLHKAMILIPLPSAANNHQLRNAEVFAQAGAAVVIRQDSLTEHLLYEKIKKILEDTPFRHQLENGTRNFNSCPAAQQVADILISRAHNNI